MTILRSKTGRSIRRNQILTTCQRIGVAYNHGFSLVELLVAMVISLFLIGGIVQLFIQNKTSYKLQEGIARAQENGRLAIHFLEKNVRRAGYPWDGKGTIAGFKKDKVPSGALDRVTPWEGDTSFDELVMQYQAPSDGSTDCTGRNITADEYVAMHFYIADPDGDGTGTLTCDSITTMNSTKTTASLITGIKSLQFTYGVDSNFPIDGLPDGGTYIDADEVGSDSWDDIVGVRATVRISVEPAELSNSSTILFTTTIPIRNQIDTKY